MITDYDKVQEALAEAQRPPTNVVLKTYEGEYTLANWQAVVAAKSELARVRSLAVAALEGERQARLDDAAIDRHNHAILEAEYHEERAAHLAARIAEIRNNTVYSVRHQARLEDAQAAAAHIHDNISGG